MEFIFNAIKCICKRWVKVQLRSIELNWIILRIGNNLIEIKRDRDIKLWTKRKRFKRICTGSLW